MSDEIRLWGAFTIAIVALIQPWVMWLAKRYLWAGDVQFHASGRYIEVGYSLYGPLVNISGSFRARDRDIFVKSATLRIERAKDKATHVFEWLAFRPVTLNLAKPHEETMEMAGGFMLLHQSPQRMRVVFSDQKTQQEVREVYYPGQ